MEALCEGQSSKSKNGKELHFLDILDNSAQINEIAPNSQHENEWESEV